MLPGLAPGDAGVLSLLVCRLVRPTDFELDVDLKDEPVVSIFRLDRLGPVLVGLGDLVESFEA